MNVFRRWWTNHGTKIIGFGTTVAGVLTYIDHETLNVISDTFGPAYGPRVVHGILIFAGLMTAKRGFTNSSKQNVEPSNQ